MITDEDIAQATDRIARTPDGELLYLYLQRIVMFVPDLSAEVCALRIDQGRRRFAADMMALMAKGIDESGGSTSTSSGTGGKRSERTVVFASRSASASTRHVSIRDHLRDNDAEFRRLTVNSDGSGA